MRLLALVVACAKLCFELDDLFFELAAALVVVHDLVAPVQGGSRSAVKPGLPEGRHFGWALDVGALGVLYVIG